MLLVTAPSLASFTAELTSAVPLASRSCSITSLAEPRLRVCAVNTTRCPFLALNFQKSRSLAFRKRPFNPAGSVKGVAVSAFSFGSASTTSVRPLTTAAPNAEDLPPGNLAANGRRNSSTAAVAVTVGTLSTCGPTKVNVPGLPTFTPAGNGRFTSGKSPTRSRKR